MRGFTLLEMITVVLISLALMLMIVPAFQVTTRAITTVNRKLEVYQAARNILDQLELNIQQAIFNERGEVFTLKSVAWQDTDPFTPDGVNPDGTKRYYQSRREADCLHFICSAQHLAPGNISSDYFGAMPYPLVYPNGGPSSVEAYRGALMPNHYYEKNSTRNASLADVSKLKVGQLMVMRDGNRSGGTPQYNDPADFFSPGNEMKYPSQSNYNALVNNAVPADNSFVPAIAGFANPFSVMDLDVAYWDDIAKDFKDPPDDTAISFAPFPKALRLTITVCDRDKHKVVTLRRIVHIPCATGDGALDPAQAAPDTVYSNPGSISKFNRTKDLKVLDPRLYSTGP
jgi:type II secretory pathway pseudopilin PulG